MESYARYIERKEKCGYPAKMNERRFKWQINGNQQMPVDPEIMPKIGLTRLKVPNEFDGGFQKFFNESKEEKPLKKMKQLVNQSFDITSRVIVPEKNVSCFF